jgi:hypothetical protein
MRGLTVTSNYLPDPQINGVNCWEAYGFKREFESYGYQQPRLLGIKARFND